MFSRSVGASKSPNLHEQLPNLGPAGLVGYHTVNGSIDRIFVSRRVPMKVLSRLASLPESTLNAELSTYELTARQPAASVPGNGSLPMPITQPGFATSYVASGSGSTDDFQHSIAIGSYRGSIDDIAVLDWWYGGGSTTRTGAREYTFPAFATADNGPVPDAHLYATTKNGDLLLVRFVGVAHADQQKILGAVSPVSPSIWCSSTGHLHEGGQQTTTLARSHNKTSWTMTLSQPRSGSVTLCLVVPALQNTGCIAGDQALPSGEQIGLVGSVAGAKPYVFGVIAPTVKEVIVHEPSGDIQAEIATTTSGGRVFVAQAAPTNGEVQVTAKGNGGDVTRPIPVSS